MYVIGGYINSSATSSVIRLDLTNPTGPWDDHGVTDLPVPEYNCRGVSYKNSIYLIGVKTAGITQSNTWRYRSNDNPLDLSQLTSIGRTGIIKYPRYGYTLGRAMRLLGTETDQQNNKIILEMWG